MIYTVLSYIVGIMAWLMISLVIFTRISVFNKFLFTIYTIAFMTMSTIPLQFYSGEVYVFLLFSLYVLWAFLQGMVVYIWILCYRLKKARRYGLSHVSVKGDPDYIQFIIDNHLC